MRTDGSGNVSWANNVTSDADWFEVGGTTPANAITDNIYTSGDVSVGKTTAATGKFDISNSTKLNTLVLENTTTSAGIKSGISNSITTQSTNNASSAIFNTISGTALSKYGVSNNFSNLNPSGLMFEYANSNFLGPQETPPDLEPSTIFLQQLPTRAKPSDFAMKSWETTARGLLWV
jgi:hypothetical protein